MPKLGLAAREAALEKQGKFQSVSPAKRSKSKSNATAVQSAGFELKQMSKVPEAQQVSSFENQEIEGLKIKQKSSAQQLDDLYKEMIGGSN